MIAEVILPEHTHSCVCMLRGFSNESFRMNRYNETEKQDMTTHLFRFYSERFAHVFLAELFLKSGLDGIKLAISCDFK